MSVCSDQCSTHVGGHTLALFMLRSYNVKPTYLHTTDGPRKINKLRRVERSENNIIKHLCTSDSNLWTREWFYHKNWHPTFRIHNKLKEKQYLFLEPEDLSCVISLVNNLQTYNETDIFKNLSFIVSNRELLEYTRKISFFCVEPEKQKA